MVLVTNIYIFQAYVSLLCLMHLILKVLLFFFWIMVCTSQFITKKMHHYTTSAILLMMEVHCRWQNTFLPARQTH